MGLFGSKKVQQATLPTTWPTAANVQLRHLDCVGESYHAEAIRSIVGDLPVWFGFAVLLPEPENPHSADAVAVYVSGKRVGYVSKQTPETNPKKDILKAIGKHGYAAVGAAITAGNQPSVTLQPSRISRPVVTSVLLQAGFRKKDGEKDWGFTIREEPTQTLVFCSGAKTDVREELVPQYAAALTAGGLRARVDKSDGLIVRVEG